MVTIYASHKTNARYFACDDHNSMVPGEVWAKGRVNLTCQYCARIKFDRAVKEFRKLPNASNYIVLQHAMIGLQDATLNHRED